MEEGHHSPPTFTASRPTRTKPPARPGRDLKERLIFALTEQGGAKDSAAKRVYLWRAGGLVQMNQDHDFAHDLTMLAMQGEMADALLASAELAAKRLQDGILQKSLPQQDNFTAVILEVLER